MPYALAHTVSRWRYSLHPACTGKGTAVWCDAVLRMRLNPTFLACCLPFCHPHDSIRHDVDRPVSVADHVLATVDRFSSTAGVRKPLAHDAVDIFSSPCPINQVRLLGRAPHGPGLTLVAVAHEFAREYRERLLLFLAAAAAAKVGTTGAVKAPAERSGQRNRHDRQNRISVLHLVAGNFCFSWGLSPANLSCAEQGKLPRIRQVKAFGSLEVHDVLH